MTNPMYKMHKNCMDVCIEVCKIQYRDAKRIKLRARWWNLGYSGNPWICPADHFFPMRMFTLEIPMKEWQENWVDITDRINIPRTKSGLP